MGNPTWMYRMAEDGTTESEIFDSDDLPTGWFDSPAKMGPKEPVGIVADTDGQKITPRRPGRPRKVKANDDGA